MIQFAIIAMLGLCGTLFVFGDRRLRALLALSSIFVASFEVEIGIGLNLPSLLAILSGALILVGKAGISVRCTRLFAGRLLLFFLWGLGVWLIGYYSLAALDNAQHGWTRGATIKPVVQLLRFLLFIPFAFIVADGLRRMEDLRWLLTWWTRVAVVSALICVAQVTVHKVSGTTLGIYNVHTGEFRTAATRIAGVKLLRASGMAGEPKAQGMAMAMSLCMLVAAWEHKLLRMPPRTHLACMALVALALLLTFSSGALVMIPVLIGLAVLNSQAQSTRRVAMASLMLICLSVVCMPTLAGSLWQVRLQKVVDLTTNLHGHGWGMDKERPAMIYLVSHPWLALSGVGVGMGPYHFDALIPLAEFRGKYVDPNSGVLWSVYGFGVIGSLLMIGGLWPEINGTEVRLEARCQTTMLLRFTLCYFLVYTPLWWLMVAVGLTCSPAAQRTRPPAWAAPLSRQNEQERRNAA